MELLIDDQAQPVESLTSHYQDDPFPGGHRYCLRLVDSGVADDLRRRFSDSVAMPSRNDTEMIFGMLRSVMTFRRLVRPDVSPAFFCNTISRMESTDDVVRCCGVCSGLGPLDSSVPRLSGQRI